MWLGLLYHPSADGDEIILCAWERGRVRPFTIAGPLSALPEMTRALRDATMRAGSVPLIPRCDCCLATLDRPLP